jgi:arylsulfatase A-like enzyme
MAGHFRSKQTKTVFHQLRDQMIDLAILSYFLVLIKWSFYITDISISFMYPLTGWKKIEIFLAGGLALTLLNWAAQVIFSLFAAAVKKPLKGKGQFLIFLVRSLVETLIAMIVVDNFTYTVFHFGILTVRQPVMLVYTLLFSGTFLLLMQLHTQAEANRENKSRSKVWDISVSVLLGLSIISVGISYSTSPVKNPPTQTVATNKGMSSYPNIIILGTDGVNAKNMSVYGYARQTTPFLDQWIQDCLKSENNFTNANKSLGSDTSLLTGKSPLDTRVIFSPDVLRGVDVSEHLPGILKSLGYKTMEQGFPYYVDPGVTNMENAFDLINFQRQTPLAYEFNQFSNFRLTDEVYLFSSIAETVSTKVKTIFFAEKAQNPYDALIGSKSFSASDHEKLASLYTALDQAKASGQPLFAHFHLMITHGDDFYPQNRVFSAGETQDTAWMDDFYDDAILDYDGYVRDLVEYLKQIGEYDNTIIVLYTDHPQQWNLNERIPLIFHFPGGEYAGQLTADTQNLDIAPTLLDYLGINAPVWMEGSSLLKPISKQRLILTVQAAQLALDDGEWAVNAYSLKPPFFQFANIDVFQCQNVYTLNLSDFKLSMNSVGGYADPCPQADLDTADEIRAALKELLTGYGYELPAAW